LSILTAAALGHDRVAGEARLAEEVRVDALLAARQRGRLVEPLPAEAQRHRQVAVGRPVGEAARAGPARVAAEDHVIADREPAHALAELLDHPRALVPEHDRLRRMPPRVLVQVGVADAGGDQPARASRRPRLLLLELARAAGASPVAAADRRRDPHAPGFPRW
jgi:hypothetical protein